MAAHGLTLVVGVHIFNHRYLVSRQIPAADPYERQRLLERVASFSGEV